MSGPSRHLDEGHGLRRFHPRIDVRCPRCRHPGSVFAGTQDHGGWDARFVCGQCQLQARREHGDWFGRVRFRGRRPCGHCGHQWLSVCETRDAPPPYPIAHRPVACPRCARSSEVAVEMGPYTPHDGHDPFFGMPLRLLEPTRCGVLWAYNAEHLRELRHYVAASQRERHKYAGNGSMISRLPAWMKLARHRPMMLKALDRLQARLLGTGDAGNDAASRLPTSARHALRSPRRR